jgi:hypothetical protein
VFPFTSGVNCILLHDLWVFFYGVGRLEMLKSAILESIMHVFIVLGCGSAQNLGLLTIVISVPTDNLIVSSTELVRKYLPTMATTPNVLSLDGLALKVNTRADVESWLNTIDPSVIEEIHLGGHTFSLEACLALAEFLEKTTVLKASSSTPIWTFPPYQCESDRRLCGYVYQSKGRRNS